MPLRYHAVTAFGDELICAVDSANSDDYGDYGRSTAMLLALNKLRPSRENARLIKDHLTSAPGSLRVMHNGLQPRGQLTAR